MTISMHLASTPGFVFNTSSWNPLAEDASFQAIQPSTAGADTFDEFKNLAIWQNSKARSEIQNIVAHSNNAAKSDLVTFLTAHSEASNETLSSLQSLDFIASGSTRGSLNPLLNAQGDELLANLLHDVAHPDDAITQGKAKTCAAASLQYGLEKTSSDQYLKMMAELTSLDEKTHMKGKDVLPFQADSLLPGAEHGRSLSERIFQTAIMEYANSSLLDYDPIGDQHLAPFHSPDFPKAGLDPYMIENVAKQLFGEDYQSYSIRKDVNPLMDVSSVAENYQKAHTALKKLENLDPDSSVPIYVGLYGNDWGHSLVFDHIDAQKNVYLRNPWKLNANDPNALAIQSLGVHPDATRSDLVYLSEDEFLSQAQMVIDAPISLNLQET